MKQSKHKQYEGSSPPHRPIWRLPLALRAMCTSILTVLTMRFFQALRRSLKNDKEKVNHISITPKSAIAIVPPKKVRDCSSESAIHFGLC